MNRDDLDSLDKEALLRLVLAQTDTIAALTREVEMLTACLSRLETDNASLRAENAALREYPVQGRHSPPEFKLIFYVRREKVRSLSGRQTHPATFAPAGSVQRG